MKAVLRAFLLLVGVVIVGGAIAAYSVASRGLSTRVAPSAIETSIALTMRRLATPSAVRGAANPVQPTPDVLEDLLLAGKHLVVHAYRDHERDSTR